MLKSEHCNGIFLIEKTSSETETEHQIQNIKFRIIRILFSLGLIFCGVTVLPLTSLTILYRLDLNRPIMSQANSFIIFN